MSRTILKSPIKNKTWTLAFLLTLVALTYGVFEIWIEHGDLSEFERAQLAHESVNTALQNYKDFRNEFTGQSWLFTEYVQQQLKDDLSLEDIITRAEKNYDFWGMSVFKNQELWLWSQFGPHEFTADIDTANREIWVDIKRNNNVTFLNYRASFEIEQPGDSLTSFTVITRRKIQQENILPIGDNSELSPSQLFQPEAAYPVHFSFFDTPPQNPQFKTKI